MNSDSLLHTIKVMRKHAHISQLSMAYALGKKDEDYYGKIERGEKHLHVYPLVKIAHELGVSPALLLYISGIQTFTPPTHTHLGEQTKSNETNQLLQSLLTNYAQKMYEKEFQFYFKLYHAINLMCRKNEQRISNISLNINCSENHYYKMQRHYLPLTVDAFKNICFSLNCSCVSLMLFAANYSWFTNKKGELVRLSDVYERFPIIASPCD